MDTISKACNRTINQLVTIKNLCISRGFLLPVIEYGWVVNIFNRWGHLLFQTKALQEGWDGKFNSMKQASGVYVWMIEAVTNQERVITKKGTVTLLR